MADKKPTSAEEDYFARENAEKAYRLAQERAAKETAAERAEKKKLHWMRCGKCGDELQTITWRNVEIEKCYQCGAIVLDDGELEKLAGSENAGQWVKGVLELFRK